MRLIPRDKEFFDMFNELATKMHSAAELLCDLFRQPDRLDYYASAIKAVEHEADAVTHDVSKRINTTFVTPFDREDIHNLAQALDNVIDLIDGTARRVQMFHISDSRESAVRLAETLLRSVEQLEKAVRNVKNAREVLQQTREAKRLEEEGDALYAAAVATLFAGTPNPLEVIKWKEIFDTLERAIDSCQTVAVVLESISLKNS